MTMLKVFLLAFTLLISLQFVVTKWEKMTSRNMPNVKGLTLSSGKPVITGPAEFYVKFESKQLKLNFNDKCENEAITVLFGDNSVTFTNHFSSKTSNQKTVTIHVNGHVDGSTKSFDNPINLNNDGVVFMIVTFPITEECKIEVTNGEPVILVEEYKKDILNEDAKIALSVVGGIVGFVLLVAAIYFIYKYCCKSKNDAKKREKKNEKARKDGDRTDGTTTAGPTSKQTKTQNRDRKESTTDNETVTKSNFGNVSQNTVVKRKSVKVEKQKESVSREPVPPAVSKLTKRRPEDDEKKVKQAIKEHGRMEKKSEKQTKTENQKQKSVTREPTPPTVSRLTKNAIEDPEKMSSEEKEKTTKSVSMQTKRCIEDDEETVKKAIEEHEKQELLRNGGEQATPQQIVNPLPSQAAPQPPPIVHQPQLPPTAPQPQPAQVIQQPPPQNVQPPPPPVNNNIDDNRTISVEIAPSESPDVITIDES